MRTRTQVDGNALHAAGPAGLKIGLEGVVVLHLRMSAVSTMRLAARQLCVARQAHHLLGQAALELGLLQAVSQLLALDGLRVHQAVGGVVQASPLDDVLRQQLPASACQVGWTRLLSLL